MKNEDNLIKNEGARVFKILYIDFQTLKGSSLHNQWWDLAIIQTNPSFYVLLNCKKEEDQKKNEGTGVFKTFFPL